MCRVWHVRSRRLVLLLVCFIGITPSPFDLLCQAEGNFHLAQHPVKTVERPGLSLESGSPEALAILRTGTTTVAFDVWQGAVWAGIIIGLLHLLPLWPLDGGHVVDSFLTGALGEHRGRRAMLIGTLVVVGVVAVLGFTASGIEAPYSFV